MERWSGLSEKEGDAKEKEKKEATPKRAMKKIPQRNEKSEGKEEKEPPQNMLDIIISRIEGIRLEIVQGREGLEKEIKQEINGLAQRIECEERWKRKEEELGKKIEEALQKIRESEKERKLDERTEIIGVVLERVEEKLKVNGRSEEETRQEEGRKM